MITCRKNTRGPVKEFFFIRNFVKGANIIESGPIDTFSSNEIFSAPHIIHGGFTLAEGCL